MPAKKNPHTMQPRQWYGTHAWRKIAAMQKRAEPLCRACRSAGRVEPAWACDHVNGFTTYNEFMLGPFQSLCKQCSDRKQRGGSLTWTGVDGWPVDARERP